MRRGAQLLLVGGVASKVEATLRIVTFAVCNTILTLD